MWKTAIDKFSKYPSQQKVIKKMLKLGLKVGETNKVYCHDVEINISSLAKSIGTDRRVVVATVQNILKDEYLKNIFTNIQSAGPVLSNISEELGLGVIEIEGDGQQVGVLKEVTEILANEEISIRQAYASDPDLYTIPRVTIITDKPVDGTVLPALLKINGISKVSIY